MIRRLGASWLTVFVLVSVVSFVCHAQPAPLLTHHVRGVTLNGQARSAGRLPSEQRLRLVVVLPLRNQPDLDRFLKELYNPASPSYRQYLTVEEFADAFGPTQRDYDAVLRWAETNGLTVAATSRNRMNVDVTGPVAAIETAFHVNMGLYQHPTENRTFYAPDREPAVDLPFPLWHIAGLDNYSIPRPLLVKNPNVTSNATTGSCPSASFCGSDMRAAYYEGTALTGSGQSVGLLEFAGTDLADLETYYANAGQTNNVPITVLSTDGTSTSCEEPDCDDTEQTIDMTQALGMAPGLASLVMYVGSTDAAIFNAMATASPLNAQLSSSWLFEPDTGVDDPYFQEFAAQGQNLFQAAGDSGAWTSSSFVYPADNMYLTSVGGTDLETSAAGGPWSSETVWVDGGGGVSPDKFAIPFWQTTTASGCSACSKNYRNGPDVAANANFTFYVCADQTTCTANLYGGTSFAAPMWAGYLALVNQQAAMNSMPPLGFINPALYDIGLSSSYDADFHDITSGSNGFSATTGYDLASGWGSPNGSGLIDGLLNTINIPGFGLTASATTVAVVQGGSATSTITSTVTNGFSSGISLSATGQPTGVTITFSPSSIAGAGASTMTIAVAASTAIGTYSIKVAGTSGSITEIVAVSLMVSKMPPNYAITASPASISVARDSAGASIITTTVSGGFDSAISLSATGYPIGVAVIFSPETIPAPGSGKSIVKIEVGKGVALGNHTITINATGGGLPRTTQITLDVVN
ncbi:MAG: S53 family serine peptidase [Bryobacteraceae bacterium]|jgi:kumamolisin